ncbi:MAG: hypothetical protein R2843_11840 [Thermomicrobiales bacterium]
MTELNYVEDLIDQDDDFDQWYVDVIRKAELADDAPVRGCKVVRPYGWAIWENVQQAPSRSTHQGDRCRKRRVSALHSTIDAGAGSRPYRRLRSGSGLGHARRRKDLEEPWAVRSPGSDHLPDVRARWIQSYRDLPMMINQWGNVVLGRRPRAFLRTLEFYWQEGHPARYARRGGRARAADAGRVSRSARKPTSPFRWCRGASDEAESSPAPSTPTPSKR